MTPLTDIMKDIRTKAIQVYTNTGHLPLTIIGFQGDIAYSIPRHLIGGVEHPELNGMVLDPEVSDMLLRHIFAELRLDRYVLMVEGGFANDEERFDSDAYQSVQVYANDGKKRFLSISPAVNDGSVLPGEIKDIEVFDGIYHDLLVLPKDELEDGLKEKVNWWADQIRKRYYVYGTRNLPPEQLN